MQEETPPPQAEPAPPEAASPQIGGFTLPDWAQTIVDDPVGYARGTLLNPDFLIPVGTQLAVIIGVLLAGIILAPTGRRLVKAGVSRLPANIRSRVDETLPSLVRPALWASFFWIAQTAMAGSGIDHPLVRIATSLATAWLIIRTATAVLPEGLRKPVTWIAWAIAVLNAFGYLDEFLHWAQTFGPPFGGRTISPAFVLQAIITAALFLYGAHWLAKRLKTRVDTLPRVEPSIRILLGNAIQVGLFFAAVILTLTGLGIPLGGLAVLGGAIGVGLGFGMQQIVANFISGVILLTDRSIKPEDVIEVDDTYGVVKSLGLRYASVITRDGKEHLIPNEQLVTNKVVNWSYSNSEVRIKRRIRVEYESDLKRAVSLCVEGALAVDRVLTNPAPKCLVMEFGDEAVELEVRFWINDPQNGINNVGSDVMLSVWDRFREAGIDIPLRHEDVLITPGSTLKVEMVREKREAAPRTVASGPPGADPYSEDA